ncbi:MAG: DUF3369 domain-containing protein [Spirochaetales bacterium]|nr:DUF3369 domain-containing protein [Spirochaetales bacterium]
MPRLNFSLKEDNISVNKEKSWKVLIVDDEISVHQMTKIIMENWKFLGRSVTLLNAYSEKEAREVLSREEDLALVFMDVIMERDDSGFRLVEYIRKKLENKFTRIVLRTGQPGALSIREIVHKYDINDYREKTQLSVDVLYTITSSCIRAYNDLKKMESLNHYTQGFFDVYPDLIRSDSLGELAVRVLNVIRNQFKLTGETGLIQSRESTEDDEPVLYVSGWIKGDGSRYIDFSEIPEEVAADIRKCLIYQEDRKSDAREYFYFRTASMVKNVLYIESSEELEEEMCRSLSGFIKNIAPLFLFENDTQGEYKSSSPFSLE